MVTSGCIFTGGGAPRCEHLNDGSGYYHCLPTLEKTVGELQSQLAVQKIIRYRGLWHIHAARRRQKLRRLQRQQWWLGLSEDEIYSDIKTMFALLVRQSEELYAAVIAETGGKP